MGEALCSTENSPFLIIDHIHAKINRVCCAALAIGKKCMKVKKNKLLTYIQRVEAIYNLEGVLNIIRSRMGKVAEFQRS